MHLSLQTALGSRSLLGGARGGPPALPSGALGIWQPKTSYVTATKTIPNLAVNGPADHNLLVAPRRQFASTFYWGHGAATITDLATAAPDGSNDATTFVAAANAAWILYGSVNVGSSTAVVQNGLTYTLAISIKDLSGGTSPNFKFGDANSTLTTFTATSSWQRKYVTFVSNGNLNINFLTPDSVQAANFAICDLQLFAGSADLNTTWQTAAPASITNADLVLNRDTSTVSGGKLTHGSQGLVQFGSGQTTGPFTLLSVVQQVSGGLAPGLGGWAPLISMMKSALGDGSYQSFSVGLQLAGRVGTQLSNTYLDAVPASGGSTLDAPMIQLSDNIFGSGGGPLVVVFRYDGSNAGFFINGIKVGDHAVSAASQTWQDIVVNNLGTQSQKFTTAYDIYELDYWGRSLTDAEVRSATLSAQARTTLGASNLCIFTGSSITQGVGTTAGYAYRVLSNLTTRFYAANMGVASTTLAALNSEASFVDAFLTTNSGILPQGKKILCVDSGSNDIYFNTWGSVSAYLAAYQSFLTARKAAGWKIVVNTILSRGDPGTPGTFDADRATINAAFRSWVGTYVDAVADWASDATIGVNGAWSNATNFQADHVHPTDAGHTLLEPYHRAAINGL